VKGACTLSTFIPNTLSMSPPNVETNPSISPLAVLSWYELAKAGPCMHLATRWSVERLIIHCVMRPGRQMSPGGRHQFSGEHIGADECDTRALSGHRRSAIGSVSHQDDSALRPSGHIDLSGRIKVPIRRRWHHFQKPRDLPADSFIDRSERLLLLNPGLQINKRRVRRRNGCK
jgi:hypothetical protein